MSLQDFPLVEGEWAVGAFVGSFASVSPLVTDNFRGRREPLAAKLTRVVLPPVKQVFIFCRINLLLLLLLLLLLYVLLLLLPSKRGGPTPSLTTTITNTLWAYLQWRKIISISILELAWLILNTNTLPVTEHKPQRF